jgi:hypothetical protein
MILEPQKVAFCGSGENLDKGGDSDAPVRSLRWSRRGKCGKTWKNCKVKLEIRSRISRISRFYMILYDFI